VSPWWTASVEIQLKPGVFDPQGQAVAGALRALGHGGIGEVRVGKQVRLRLSAAGEEEARAAVERMCRELLANPVLEDYRFTLARE
jgi:phosphoribosylformylglycinamidine synthase PurS subunit